jgi:hypothetical protein
MWFLGGAIALAIGLLWWRDTRPREAPAA